MGDSFPGPFERLQPGAFLSTGMPELDSVLGAGLPRGRIVEVYGPAGCGKTTLGLNWIVAAQQAQATAVFVDVDRALDLKWAKACGVDLEELVLLRPDSGPEAVSMIEALLRTFSVDLVVVDSVAALVSAEELEASLEDAPMDLQLDFVSRSLRRLHALVGRGPCSLVFLNQSRARNPDAPPVGVCHRALGSYCSIRIRLDARPGGISLLTEKNKFAEPFESAALDRQGPKFAWIARKEPGKEGLPGRAMRHSV